MPSIFSSASGSGWKAWPGWLVTTATAGESRRTAKPARSDEESQAPGTMIWQAPFASLSAFHGSGSDSGAAGGNKANRAKTPKYLMRRLYRRGREETTAGLVETRCRRGRLPHKHYRTIRQVRLS